MKNKKPPFEITEKMIADIADICELVGRISISGRQSPQLRKTNRIRTIYSSLAIEQNTLDIEQVTAVISGKRVLAPPKDIAEVKNAYEIYEHMDLLDPYDMNDLLNAHKIMMQGLTQDAGEFRTRPVGVVDSGGKILHFGTLPQYVPQLVEELLDWTKKSALHMLIKSCVFHYEFEVIHPFSDGNGRCGRLWHTLLLSQWNPVFAWLPIESIIHDNQDKYYEAINISNAQAESTVFIEFMLSVIKTALKESDGVRTPKKKSRMDMICEYLKNHEYITNSDVQTLLGVSSATATRILAEAVKSGIAVKVRIGSHWGYKKVEEE